MALGRSRRNIIRQRPQLPLEDFETIRMTEGENPLRFLGKAADQLAPLGCSKRVEKVNQHITRNLSSLYKIQRMSILARPKIPARRSMKSFVMYI